MEIRSSRRPTGPATLLCWVVALFPVSSWAAPITHIEPLGETAVPVRPVAGAQVGGLSGLTWDPEADRYWALSDDRAERGPVRAYRLRLDFEGGRLQSVEVEGHLDLRLADGAGFGAGRVDPEGIARLPDGSFLVASEGVVRWEVAPFLRVFGPDGIERYGLPLPARYATRRDRQAGVRDNLGFESATVTADGRWAFTALESSLIQDAGGASAARSSPTRILRFDLERRRLDAELVYWVDPLQRASGEARINVAGVVDLLALERDRLLVLERAFATGVGNRIRLYEVTLEGAEDVRDVPALAGRTESVRAVEKKLLLDVAALGIVPDNIEGLAFGPDLPDGRRLLLLLADDNFAYPLQRSQLLAFAVDDRPIAISEVQGAAHRSPLEGGWVRGVEGVVTAVLESRGRRVGFWIEATDDRRDADERTSEGLFVALPEEAGPAVGDAVRVQGAVREIGSEPELTATRLLGGSAELVAVGVELPPPVDLLAPGPLPAVVDDDGLSRFEPATDAVDRLESVEGMRVRLPPAQVVGPTQSYGEVAVLPDGTGHELVRTGAGGVVLPAAGAVPGPLLVGGRLARAPRVAVGDRLAGLIGVMDYAWGKYVVEALAWPPPVAAARPLPARQAGADGGHFTVATFNVLNLDPSDPPARLNALGAQIVDGLGAPDVLALQEVQDDSGAVDDGTVSAAATLSALVDAVEAAGGPRYAWRQLDPMDGREGGEPGGNIRVAFLFDPARVAMPEEELERLGSADPAFAGGRPCLAGTILFGAQGLQLVNCHLTSKRGDDPLYGTHVPARHGSEAERLAQAEVVARWVEARLAADPDARVVVLGDLNDYELSAPVARLVAAGLRDLVLTIPASQRYTFNYQGFSQVLDHVLVSPALAGGASARVVHVNADLPSAERASDHDPVVARLCPSAPCAEDAAP
jgi:hypothetical protein